MELPLKALLVSCQRGDANAQFRLFERYNKGLFLICLRYAKDRPEAQDILQEAFLTIFKDLGQYKGDGAFEGWLHKVTVRTALQHLRRKNPLRFAEDYNQLPPQAFGTAPDSDLSGEAILHLVQQLPDGYRTVFNMHGIEAWSYTEIAAELGITESSVRSQYTRACKQLRLMVDKLFTCLI
jgi:RNA polymerase sigma-70 factor (ECF subfamily)